MLEPWNDASILPPPINTTPASSNSQISAKKLKHICRNISTILSQQSPLHRESALLSRFLYKFDKKFRNDIGYRSFKKVNTALHKYLALNLKKDIEYFYSALPTTDQELFLPTRQMLEYVLVCLLTFTKIMMRICLCSKQAAVFYMDRIKRAESHWMSLMPYALLSRVWSVCLILLEHSITWYTNLYSFLNKLELKGLNFLPSGYKLPDDIEKWLDIKNLENHGRFCWTIKRQVQIDSKLIESCDGDFADNILDYVKQINDDDENQDSNVNLVPDERICAPMPIDMSEINIDKGESISREHFKSFFKQEQSQKHRSIHSADNVTNKPSLQKFLNEEESLRNIFDDKSLTKHLSFMQWQTLKTALLKLGDSLANNRKIERKFQKIWKEKCLDYLE